MPNKLSQYKFYLLRHGESIWNREKKFTGWTNVPMTSRGINQSNLAFNIIKEHNLKPTVIYTSQLDRALHTSCIIKKQVNNHKNDHENNISIIQNWRLNEKNYGSLEGMEHTEFENSYGKTELNNVIYKFEHPIPLVRNIFYDRNYQPLINKYIYSNDKLNKSYEVINLYSLFNSSYKPYHNYYLKHLFNGETNKVVMDRVLFYFNHAIFPGMKKGEVPLIISHKHVGRVMMKHFLNMNNDIFEKYEFYQNELYEITIDENKNLKSINSIKIIE